MARLQATRTRVEKARPPGLATGLRSLDEHLGGLHQGVHLLAGAPGAGKTALALQIARNVASDGASVVYLSFDEPSDRLALKLTTGYGGPVAADYLKGKADPADLLKVEQAHHAVLNRIRIHNGPSNLQGETAGEMLDEAKSSDGAAEGLLIVDFLQGWAARQSGSADFRFAVTHLVGQLREVAINYRVPVLAIIAQDRLLPGEASLRLPYGASHVESIADTICLLSDKEDAEDASTRRQVALSCSKNRWGALFSQRLLFDTERGAFSEDPGPRLL